jgi:surface antigen
MRGWGTSAKSLLFGSFLALSCQTVPPPAEASPSRQPAEPQAQASQVSRYASHPAGRSRTAQRGRQASYGGISCVPFARNDSGISVVGNAWQWWDNAAGIYARGSVPEPGSVLAFRANGRMRLGHVAVVTRVINPREVEIEHANWRSTGMRGSVMRNTPVVDVSPANDWTAVRVGLGQAGEFGSVYPTYGFIYDRPDTGTMLAANAVPAPQPDLNPAPSDLRPAGQRGWQTYEEVAEAPVVRRYKRPVHPVATHTR